VKPGTFYGVGVGPGDPELVTMKAVSVLQSCASVFVPKARTEGESVALAIAQRYVRADARVDELVFPMSADRGVLEKSWKQSAEAIAPVLESGADACFLTLGDPFVYSTYIYLLDALQQRLPDLQAVTVPGVTSFCAAAALTQSPLGEGKDLLTIVPTADDLSAVRRALQTGGTVVLMKIGQRLPQILDLLEETGRMQDGVFVARAGLPGERIELDLRKLCGGDPQSGYLSVMIIRASREAL
jgi:precorrin-2/cobalt-factor-2 C20-methyltransferase